jgi:hypothetical protein
MTKQCTEYLLTNQATVDICDSTSPRINLATSEDIRREMAKVYRETRFDKISPTNGTKLVYMLSQLLKAHEIFILEKKVSELELIAPRGIRCG